MRDKGKIKDLLSQWKNSYHSWEGYFGSLEEDFEFKLGKQWSDADEQKLKDEKRPILSINNIKKPCDLIEGHQRQYPTDIHVIPIDGTDQEKADVFSETIKWVMADGDGNQSVSQAFSDGITGGIGWVHAYFDNDRDMANGDIYVQHESPFRIIPDPELSKMDLSDCGYIFRHAWISKESAASIYEDHAKEIKALKGGNTGKFLIQEPLPNTNNTHVTILEKWYREYVNKTYIVDTTTQQVSEFTGSRRKLSKLEDMIKNNPDDMVPGTTTPYGLLDIIKRKEPIIKMTSICEDKIILYDDVNPYGIDMYPFIPCWAYYSPAFNNWNWKLQGVVRSLKDSQREKNKRRSKLLHAAMTLPYSAWLYKQGTVQDPDQFKKSGEVGLAIPYEGDTPPIQSQPVQISQALVQLEEMHTNDIRTIGPNADLLGMSGQQGGSGMGAPGISIQLRQKQGLTSIQTLFDNLSFHKRMLGRYLIKLITQKFSDEKIMRIINRELPEGFRESMEYARYDCQVDEVVESSTNRAYNFTVLVDLAKNGYPVPNEMLIESSDLPAKTKQQIAQSMRAQAQAQQQAAQAEQQKQAELMELEKNKLFLEFKKVELDAIEKGLKIDLSMEKLFAQERQAERDLQAQEVDAIKQGIALTKETRSKK